jgi:hypothetical protein
MFNKENLKRHSRTVFGARTLLVVLIVGAAQPNFAENAKGPAFDSAEQTVEALYTAVKNNDHANISQLIGPLASSDDIAQDEADREQFVLKFNEMHRLVKKPDGTATLYLGAENWPFPVPLISNNGKWQFDLDAGVQEIAFRRIGEDEVTAMETCRALARALIHHNAQTDDDAVNQYVQKVVEAANPMTESFHGYYFRLLRTSNGAVVVAYPSEYRSTGVMTFAATSEGPVYEKDLGPSTVELATTMTRYKADPTWHAAE